MKKLLSLIVAISLSACAALDYNQGTKVSNDTYAKFAINKTTKTDVLNTLGLPQKSQQDGSNFIIVYSYDTITAIPGQKNKNESVMLTFNKSGSLIAKNRTSGNVVSANPLTGQ